MMIQKHLKSIFGLLIFLSTFVFSTSLWGQTITTFDAENKALLEKLGNIPARLQNRINTTQAERAANVWLHICPEFNQNNFSIGEIEMIADADQTRPVAFLVHLQPQGFIILSADSDIRPIVGYSAKNNFRTEETCDNTGLSMVRTGLSLHLAALEEGIVLPGKISQARALWHEYIALVDANGEFVGGDNYDTLDTWDVEVGPLVSSTWNQGTAYGDPVWNYYTPPNDAGNVNNYVCGCVATAMGQILNYYEWPITGTGSHTYTWDNGTDPAQNLSAHFGATTYDWSNTLDNYYQSTTLAQRQAAGELVYHCGVSVEMNYTSTGSGSYTSDAANAMSGYFRTSAVWRQNDGPGFFDDLYATTINERPSELSIGSPCGGHAIVVDGVHHNTGGTKYYHLNMGWGGYDDGWYDISDDFTAGGCTWDDVRGCVMQIIPAPDLDDPGSTLGSTTFPVSWQVAALDNAENYELQQSFIPTTLTNFFDGAENGGSNWDINGDWEVSSARKYTGSYSFRGFVGNVGFSTLQLANAVKISATTSLTYNWGINYQINAHVLLQVSNDGSTWTTLKTYNQSDSDGSINWYSENSIDLSAYVGEILFIRFAYDHQGGGYYSGLSYNFVGFFLDDISITNCSLADDWQTVDDNLMATSTSVTVSQDGEYSYRARAFADGAWRDWSNIETIKIMQPPSTQATDVSCTAPSGGQLDISWTRGNGDGSIVFMREGASGEAAPVDNVYYTANAEFAAGDQIGTSGWYCVYDGTGTEVTVTGLSETGSYRLHVCEYKLGSIVYNSTSSTGNPANTQDPIDVNLISLTACFVDGHIRLDWTTASEIDIAGFNILASHTQHDNYRKINSTLIQGQGDATSGKTYSFVDASELIPHRWYKLETINLDGRAEQSAPVTVSSGTRVETAAIPAKFMLHPNYPNPFNPETTIQFDLPAQSFVLLTIYDMHGRVVRTLVNGTKNIGTHNVTWDGSNDKGEKVSSGLYFYRLEANTFSDFRKMTFLK
jgi:hypothetical protein